jgi:hypothetical protein
LALLGNCGGVVTCDVSLVSCNVYMLETAAMFRYIHRAPNEKSSALDTQPLFLPHHDVALHHPFF